MRSARCLAVILATVLLAAASGAQDTAPDPDAACPEMVPGLFFSR